LTARSEDYSQIAGFRAGADDYIAKPVNLKVLSYRIKALLKRYGNNNIETDAEIPNVKKQYGNLEIDKEKHHIIIDGKEINLPKKEFKLLLLLSSKPGKVFTRDNILSHVWGSEVIVEGRTIDVHIRNIREKIGNHRIITYKGVGYKFVD
jgi:two-component system alkaline phosphatase synthesis response regulator PhoP